MTLLERQRKDIQQTTRSHHHRRRHNFHFIFEPLTDLLDWMFKQSLFNIWEFALHQRARQLDWPTGRSPSPCPDHLILIQWNFSTLSHMRIVNTLQTFGHSFCPRVAIESPDLLSLDSEGFSQPQHPAGSLHQQVHLACIQSTPGTRCERAGTVSHNASVAGGAGAGWKGCFHWSGGPKVNDED